ncbi:MAG: DUF4147 domain-containing protein [Betaproteobacteria bacterium]|nr:DUF4147 domain-containing protein [Betaproteobacteria bacterium]
MSKIAQKKKAEISARLLKQVFADAIDEVRPEKYLPRYVPAPVAGDNILIAVGKGAQEMAKVFAKHFKGKPKGLVVTPDKVVVADQVAGLDYLTASHPLPDESSLKAGTIVAKMIKDLGRKDQVVLLLSGGASSLLCLPATGVTLTAKRDIYRGLLDAGAPISDINCVRRALSGLKGGRLALLAQPARVTTVAVSDVPGDYPHDIGSGPTVVSPSGSVEASNVLRRWGIKIPGSVSARLRTGGKKITKNQLAASSFHLGASPRIALEAACKSLSAAGFATINLGSCLTGEAREVASAIAGIARGICSEQCLAKLPVALVSGGELTVSVGDHGGSSRGGPNCEFATALALKMRHFPNSMLLAVDTDGIDGNASAAGAIVTAALCSSQADRKAAATSLDKHSTAAFLERHGCLLKPGPTGVNVNDLRVLLLGKTDS